MEDLLASPQTQDRTSNGDSLDGIQDRKLETKNREREALANAVSHDLRSPVRTIPGFGQALLDDCGDKLPGDAQAHLARIQAAAVRMGQIIDALVELSHTNKRVFRGVVAERSFSSVTGQFCRGITTTQQEILRVELNEVEILNVNGHAINGRQNGAAGIHRRVLRRCRRRQIVRRNN